MANSLKDLAQSDSLIKVNISVTESRLYPFCWNTEAEVFAFLSGLDFLASNSDYYVYFTEPRQKPSGDWEVYVSMLGWGDST